VRIGADDSVRVGFLRCAFFREYHATEEFEVDLVDDAGVGRHDLEVCGTRSGPSAGTNSARHCARIRCGLLLVSDSGVPYSSTWTEWSMTSSAGASGLTFSGLPPRRAMASRIAARSTTQGTPVKSCMMTRAGVKENLVGRDRGSIPVQQCFDVLARDIDAILEAQQVLEQDLQGVGQACDFVLRQRRETPDRVGPAVPR